MNRPDLLFGPIMPDHHPDHIVTEIVVLVHHHQVKVHDLPYISQKHQKGLMLYRLLVRSLADVAILSRNMLWSVCDTAAALVLRNWKTL